MQSCHTDIHAANDWVNEWRILSQAEDMKRVLVALVSLPTKDQGTIEFIKRDRQKVIFSDLIFLVSAY